MIGLRRNGYWSSLLFACSRSVLPPVLPRARTALYTPLTLEIFSSTFLRCSEFLIITSNVLSGRADPHT